VKIEERKTIAGLLTEWIISAPGSVMEAQTKIIKGYPVMKKTAFHLKLIDENSPESSVHQAITNIRSKISTDTIERTNIIRIIATSVDPEEALVLANTVAQVYTGESLLEKNKQARTTRTFIEDQLSLLEKIISLLPRPI